MLSGPTCFSWRASGRDETVKQCRSFKTVIFSSTVYIDSSRPEGFSTYSCSPIGFMSVATQVVFQAWLFSKFGIFLTTEWIWLQSWKGAVSLSAWKPERIRRVEICALYLPWRHCHWCVFTYGWWPSIWAQYCCLSRVETLSPITFLSLLSPAIDRDVLGGFSE